MIAFRVIGFGGLWWLLAGGDASSWIVGIPTTVAAAVASVSLSDKHRPGWRPGVAVAFAAFFLRESVRSGVAVARLAFARRPALAPALVEVRLTLPAGAPRILLINVVSLLPGSVSAGLSGDRLVIHVLAGADAVEADVRALEARVARLFGLPPRPHQDLPDA